MLISLYFGDLLKFNIMSTRTFKRAVACFALNMKS